MLGVVQNYRRGPKSQKAKDSLIKIFDSEDKKSVIIGLKVGWPRNNPRIFGKIIQPHGRTGTYRVKFSKNLPGQALGTQVIILER
jgi:ribosomal protein L35AE/L33A